MVEVETYLDRFLVGRGAARSEPNLERTVAGFGESVARLEGTITRFERALQTLAADTKEFREFNLHIVSSKASKP